jgi:hypothetical protein
VQATRKWTSVKNIYAKVSERKQPEAKGSTADSRLVLRVEKRLDDGGECKEGKLGRTLMQNLEKE